MKAVILAGGLGTRISEETHLKPKPRVDEYACHPGVIAPSFSLPARTRSK
jgi:dTDP-glucose pyrophosphorylase